MCLGEFGIIPGSDSALLCTVPQVIFLQNISQMYSTMKRDIMDTGFTALLLTMAVFNVQCQDKQAHLPHQFKCSYIQGL